MSTVQYKIYIISKEQISVPSRQFGFTVHKNTSNPLPKNSVEIFSVWRKVHNSEFPSVIMHLKGSNVDSQVQ